MVLTSSLYCTICGACNETHAHFCFACNQPLSAQQTPIPAELLPHTLFENRYHIIARIGAGGFGSVYKATDTQSRDRLVALKEVKLLGLPPQAMILFLLAQR